MFIVSPRKVYVNRKVRSIRIWFGLIEGGCFSFRSRMGIWNYLLAQSLHRRSRVSSTWRYSHQFNDILHPHSAYEDTNFEEQRNAIEPIEISPSALLTKAPAIPTNGIHSTFP